MFAWLEAFHLISVVCWFAALFYLPRLFVYHAMAEDEVGRERFKVMERKLYRGIATPSMIATVLFGVALASSAPRYYLEAGWFHAKLALVALLVVYHHLCLYYLKRFAADRPTPSHRFFRWFNEVPALFLVAIVILAVVKPF
ncbi:MAG: membrane protein [Porticoccaceae bacterium]|nr:MAG: membrane protein [Porticoccaceae bacterium]